MMAKKSGLGRGLETLLSQSKQYTSPKEMQYTQVAEKITDAAVGLAQQNITYLPIEYLRSGYYQPRQHFDQDALNELASSVRVQGIMQPLLVRKCDSKSDSQFPIYEIIAGERRWRAAQIAQLHVIPVIIRVLTDQEALAIALIENIQRQNLNAIEEARALQRLIDEFQVTHQQLGSLVGRSRSAITNLLRLLALPDFLQQLLIERVLEMGHARALLAVPLMLQKEISQLIQHKNLSVRETERLVKKRLQQLALANEIQQKMPFELSESSEKIQYLQDIKKLEQQLTQTLGSHVACLHKKTGAGQLRISYQSLDELDGLLEKFGYRHIEDDS